MFESEPKPEPEPDSAHVSAHVAVADAVSDPLAALQLYEEGDDDWSKDECISSGDDDRHTSHGKGIVSAKVDSSLLGMVC